MVDTWTRTSEHRPPPPEPVEGPPAGLSPAEWIRANLFNTWYNAVLTLVFAPLIAWVVFRALRFVFVSGRWEIIRVNLLNFMVGTFPRAEVWRPWAAIMILAVVVGVGLGVTSRATLEAAEARGASTRTGPLQALRRGAPPLALLVVLVVFARTVTPLLLLVGAVILGAGGYLLGRRVPPRHRRWANLGVVVGMVAAYAALTTFGGVPVDNWGGLMLTLFLAAGGISLSFPLGVALALGRRSTLPAVRAVCVGYIELIRGTPLIALLFMGWLLLPFFLPVGFPIPSRPWRALIIFVLFTAAYVAEIVRGGLQGVPKGQYEASMALGLSPWKQTRLVVLPQALRSVIPAMVGQFISLYKDTSLVLVIGLLDLLAVGRRVTQQPGFLGQGLHAEALLFVSFVYWAVCYWMSRESQMLEKRLGVGER